MHVRLVIFPRRLSLCQKLSCSKQGSKKHPVGKQDDIQREGSNKKQKQTSSLSTKIYSTKITIFSNFWWSMKYYHIMRIIRRRKVSRISRIWKHSWMFSCTFYLGRNFYRWDCLNCENFLANYSKEGNLRNFSSADDSRYTVFPQFLALRYLVITNSCKISR